MMKIPSLDEGSGHSNDDKSLVMADDLLGRDLESIALNQSRQLS